MKKIVSLFAARHGRRKRNFPLMALNDDISRIYGRTGMMFWR